MNGKTTAIASTATELPGRVPHCRRRCAYPSSAFSRASPGVLLGSVGDYFHYAFNLDNPDGVKLLNRGVFARLRKHLATLSAPGADNGDEQQVDQALYQHGLIKNNGAYAPIERIGKSEYSLSVWLNVIDGCNLSCFYCYIPELQKSIDPASVGVGTCGLDAATATSAVRRLKIYCKERGLKRLHIKFAGGEPTLLMPQIDQFCEQLKAEARDLDVMITFGMLTNGLFAAAEVLPVIHRQSMSVSISVDGMWANHDRIRYRRVGGGRKGTWTEIFENVDRLLAVGIKPYFLYTITQKNLHDIEPFAQHAHKLGCGFRLSLERAHKPVNSEQAWATAEHLRGFYRRLGRNAPLNLRLDRAAKFAEWNLNRKKSLACSTGRGYFAIGRDGRVASCQMRLDEPIGDVRVDSLAAIFERLADRHQTRKLQYPEEKAGACVRCEFRFVCAGGCPQHTRNVWGDMDLPSPWCFVYGRLIPKYIEACAIHLARRIHARIDGLERPATPIP